MENSGCDDMKISKFLQSILLLICCSPIASFAINESNAVTAGLFYGGAVPHTGAVIEYERRVKRSLSLGLQLGGFKYDYKDGDFQEKGQRTGANLILRFSPGYGFKGFYIGGGFGYWGGYYDYVDPQDDPSSGHIKTPSIILMATSGWRIPLGDSRFYIDPRLSWGTLMKAGGSSYLPGNDEDNSVVRNFLSLGVNVGVKF